MYTETIVFFLIWRCHLSFNFHTSLCNSNEYRAQIKDMLVPLLNAEDVFKTDLKYPAFISGFPFKRENTVFTCFVF